MSKTEQKDKPLGEQFKETYSTRKRKREDDIIQDVYEGIVAICTTHLEKNDPGCRIGFDKLGNLKDKSTRDGVIKKLKDNKFDAGQTWVHGRNCGDNDCGSDCGPTAIFVSWDGTHYDFCCDKLPLADAELL